MEEVSSEELNIEESSNEPIKEPTKRETVEDWLDKKVLTWEKQKSTTEQQSILIMLYRKEHKTPQDDKKLSVLIKAERATERASNARKAATLLLQAEKNAEKKAERKARDHELYNSAGLLILAGLVNTKTGKPTMDKAELLGALLGLAKVSPDNPKRAEWKKAGEAKLKELESKK